MQNFLFVGKVIQDKLYKRFKLRDYPPIADNLVFSKLILPVTQMDRLLQTIEIKNSGDITVDSTGAKTFFTIPTREIWTILAIRLHLSTGAYTFTQISIRDDKNVKELALDVFSATADHSFSPGQPLPLEHDWLIKGYVNAKTVNGNARMDMLILNETAYTQ